MIHFNSEDAIFDLPDKEGIVCWINDVVKNEGQATDEINFIFCSDDYLLSLNQQYLDHNYFTDILTFDYRDTSNQPLTGDIYISIDRVIENARQHDMTFDNELQRVMIHGILHMLGYNDHTPEEKASMRKKEDACLSLRK